MNRHYSFTRHGSRIKLYTAAVERAQYRFIMDTIVPYTNLYTRRPANDSFVWSPYTIYQCLRLTDQWLRSLCLACLDASMIRTLAQKSRRGALIEPQPRTVPCSAKEDSPVLFGASALKQTVTCVGIARINNM